MGNYTDPKVHIVIGRTLGNYEVLDAIGAGGMGQVYKARDTRLNRLVAIKVVRQDLASNPSRRQRFLQEAKSASALNHPNIITIYDIFEFDGMDCLVMEYLGGKTLHDLIPKQGMPLPEVLRISSQVAEGLSRAHGAGLVHRDIKPSNILVSDNGAVKILDFGLAKTFDTEKIGEGDRTRTVEPITEEGAVIGTVSYMSPEQAQGKPVDSRSDIFSFGSTLYEMLTGRRAFAEDSGIGTLAAILHRDPAPLPAAVPQALSQVILKCLLKDRDARWQSLGEVKQLLEEAANPHLSFPANAAAIRLPSFFWTWTAVVCAMGGLATYAVFRSVPAARKSAPVVLHKITAEAGLTGYPTISRDGKLIAFASDRAKEDNLDIWVQQTGGGDPIQVTRDPADESDPSFSPDATLIAFRSEKDGGGIYVIPSFGGPPILLAARGRNPRFSPDGKWVAYSVGGSAVSNPGTTGVFIVSSGGGVPRAIHAEMATATNPVWSPVSDRLLVLGRKDPRAPARSELDWWILPVDGGSPERTGAYARLRAQNLEELQFRQIHPAPLEWRDAGGDRILFSASSGEAANLWELPLKGTEAPQRVTLGPGTHRSANWSGDGTRLVFASEELGFDLWLQPLDASGGARGEMKRLTVDSVENFTPSITWDGTKIAYVSHGSGDFALRLLDSASGLQRTVFTSPTRIINARLSGDGARIVYTNTDYDLLSVASTGGTAQKLCDRCGTVTGVSDDGRAVLFEPMQDEDVMLYDPSHPVPVKLAMRPNPDLLFSGGRFSRDGKWIAFHALRNATNTGQIWIAPASPSAAPSQSNWIAVTDGSWLERDPAWSADGRFVYFISERDGFRCIWAQPLNLATKQRAGSAFAVRHFHSARFSLRYVGSSGFLTGIGAGLSSSHTAGSLIFSVGELKANVWLQENAK
jgi:eukaryotic-like serine/threonine-protein kinase